MRRRAIIGLGLSCLLTACTHGGYGAVDLGWSLHHAEGEGAWLVEAMAPATDPALRSFARTGDIAAMENGRVAHMPVRQAERATVADFFAECRAA